VSHSTKQEKKRKRPDDKRQNVAKKAGGGRGQQQYKWPEQQDKFGSSSNTVALSTHQNVVQDDRASIPQQAKSNYDQDYSGGKSGIT